MSDIQEFTGDGYRLVLNGFDPISTSKGWFGLAVLETGGKTYRIMFYDKVRLLQDIEGELETLPLFFESNLVVVPEVTPEAFVAAMDRMIKYRELDKLLVAV